MARSKTKEKSKKRTKNKLSTGKKKERMRHELKFLSPDEKMEYLLENGHLIKDRLFNEISFQEGKMLPKEAMAIGPNNLKTRSGELRQRQKRNLKYLDQILMTEFNISPYPINSDIQTDKPPNRENNNDTDISDHNSTATTPKDTTKETKQTKDTNKTVDNVTQMANADATVSQDASSSKGTGRKKSKKNNAEKIKETHPVHKKYKYQLVGKLKKVNKLKLTNGIVLSFGSYECDYCHKTLNTKSCLQRHIKMHLNIKPYACAHCPMKFLQCCNWKAHMKNIHPEAAAKETFVCFKCGKGFKSKEELDADLAIHFKKENPFKCVFCDKAFATHALMAEHEKVHMNPGRYKCAICPMSYESRSRYSLHIKSHMEGNDMICPYCNKTFLRPSSIKRHIEIYHVGIRMECPICKKKLKGHLTEHIRTHDNERPHVCSVCGQRFTQSTQLTVHKRSHSGDKPYTCRICKRSFSHSNALMLHIRRHTGEKPFTCAMCPVSFSQLPHMKCHMLSIHGKDKCYKCEKCHTFFKLKSELELHDLDCEATVQQFTLDGQDQAEAESSDKPAMTISKMRFLLALLFTMIASKDKLKCLGFNKRPIDDILVESVEAMGQHARKKKSLDPLVRLKANTAMLLKGTVPKDQMAKFKESNKTTEDILELLVGDKPKQK